MNLIFFLALISITSAWAHTTSEKILEASGICLLKDSAVVAGDDENHSLWLVGDNDKTTKVKVKNGKWDDMEDLSRVNDELFFATASFGRTKNGKRKATREKLFLMKKSGQELTVQHEWSFRDQLISELKRSLSQEIDLLKLENEVPDKGGLNVEGMAFVGGKLYLGLRSPLTRKGEGIIVVINNADEMLSGKMPVFGETMSLDLKGNGVRGLTAFESNILILSGSRDDKEKVFALYQFSPPTKTLSSFHLKGFEKMIRPEGIGWKEKGHFILVQDLENSESVKPVVHLSR